MNNKGQGIFIPIIFVGLLLLVLFVGVLMAFGGAVTNWVADNVIPEISSLGVVGNTNLTQVAEITIAPVNTLIQTSTWLTGVFYFILLIFSIIFAVAMRYSGTRWMMGVYFVLALMLIMASVFVSNIYQDFHDGTDEVAQHLQEQTLLSFMILYSPAIFTFIVFLTGIVMFSGMQEEEFT